jgi:hypothetical protein
VQVLICVLLRMQEGVCLVVLLGHGGAGGRGVVQTDLGTGVLGQGWDVSPPRKRTPRRGPPRKP